MKSFFDDSSFAYGEIEPNWRSCEGMGVNEADQSVLEDNNHNGSLKIAFPLEKVKVYTTPKKGNLGNAFEAIFQSTLEGDLISANPAMADLFGFDSPKALKKTVTDFPKQLYVSPEKGNEFINLLNQCQRLSGYKAQFYKKDGSKFWALLHARLIFNNEKNINSIEGTVTDITEQKERMKVVCETVGRQSKDPSQLRSQVRESCQFGDIIGKSLCMQDVYELISKASSSDANVIVYGESGTGKELVANAVHRMSNRKANRIVPVNCGAISEQLLESEFFGYKKGAFTGANADKQGFLDFADDGTLFLDELGELNLNIQAKLLRAIDGGGYTPVGSAIVKKSNFRIIAATNRDLQNHVAKGLMREDFFYRIHVIPIHLPPLRKRKEDIPLLIDHFLKAYDCTKEIPSITGSTLEQLLNYPWPGNVRELENTLHRFVTIGKLDFLGEPKSNQISKKDLVLETIIKETLGLQEATAHFEKMYIYNILEQNKWHRKNVASILKISRRTLYDKMKNYQLLQTNQENNQTATPD